MITKDLMRTLRTEIDAALVAIGGKHNLDMKLGNGSYSMEGTTASYKINIAIQGTSKEAELLRRYYPQYIGKEISGWVGDRYRIVGVKSRGTSFIGERVSDGKRFRLPYLQVTQQLGVK